MDSSAEYERELDAVLPADMPHRRQLIEKSALHLRLIADANEYMNLTRISTPREAAIKHVLDCVWPWRFFEKAPLVLDAGTGAGFPGLPLAVALPQTCFVLAESTGKKARFVEMAAEALDLPNVQVIPERAEALAIARRPPLITARAVGPAERLVDLFAKSLATGSELLLYKGPDVATELAALDHGRIEAQVVSRYQLPFDFGARTLIRVTRAAPRKRARANPQ